MKKILLLSKEVIEYYKEHYWEGQVPSYVIENKRLPEGEIMRPTFITVFMELAKSLQKRATCSRSKVGCVVVSEDFQRVYGIGYNGNYKGGPNKCDSDQPGNCGCLHAEDNALLKVSERPSINKVMFVTMSPCIICAKRIINKGGFTKIYFEEKYRNVDGIQLLRSQGINCIQVWYNEATQQHEEMV